METSGVDSRLVFGAALRAARESKGLAVNRAAAACHLSEEQVRGLETNQSGSFYSELYLARAARRYAEFLGVPLIADYLPTQVTVAPARPDTPDAAEMAQVPSLWRHSGAKVVGALLAVVVAIALAVHLISLSPRPDHHAAELSSLSPSSESPVVVQSRSGGPSTLADADIRPVDSPGLKVGESTDPSGSRSHVGVGAVSTAGPARPPLPVAIVPTPAKRMGPEISPGNRFFVEILQEVGITAKDSGGRLLLHGRLSANTRRRLVGTPPFNVVATNADAVAVYYRGRKVRLVPDTDGEWRAEFGAQ